MDSITGLRFKELEKRPTYDDLIEEIINGFKLKVPDRTAAFIYSPPWN